MAMRIEDDWQESAKCKGAKNSLFYGHTGSYTEPKMRPILLAALEKYCWVCPVKDECLEYAIATQPRGQEFGIWGGKTPKQRVAIRRNRRRALGLII